MIYRTTVIVVRYYFAGGKMHFIIRKARMEDLNAIMEIMEEGKNKIKNKEWFVADDKEYVKNHLEKQGFCVVAETEEQEIAGFFLIKFLKEEDEITHSLFYDKEKIKKTAVMDSAVVKTEYRGNSLQYKMLKTAEKMLDKKQYQYLICTIHPDNVASLRSMQKNGFIVKQRTKCYGGLLRYILEKDYENCPLKNN